MGEKWRQSHRRSQKQKHDRKNLDEVLKYKKISSPKGCNSFKTLYVTAAAYPPSTQANLPLLLKSHYLVVTATPPGFLWKPTVETYLKYCSFSGRKSYLHNRNTDKVPGRQRSRLARLALAVGNLIGILQNQRTKHRVNGRASRR